MTGKLLEIKNLYTSFSTTGRFNTVIDGVSLTVNKNEIFAIVGESGCGKSALALSIAQLHDQSSTKLTGEILFHGHDLLKFNESQLNRIRGKSIGMIFQGKMNTFDPLLCIGAQMEEGLAYHTDLDKHGRKEYAIFLLGIVGIAHPEFIYTNFPHELSDEVRQRIMIAIAISSNPNLIIADEPTATLDTIAQFQILTLLKKLQAEAKSSMVLATRNLGVAAEIADRIAIMQDGQIVECSSVTELFGNPKHAYTQSLIDSTFKRGA